MSSFEINKILASILLALIVAWVSALLASKLIEPKSPSHAAIAVASAPAAQPATAEAAGPDPLEPVIASASPEAGKEVAKKCAACHTFDKGGPNRVGPNLWDVMNEPVAEGHGFAFSDALKKKGGTWTVDALNTWLWKPQAFVKGTKMTFVGLPKAKDRADVIAYLNTLSDAPKPLTSQ